MRRTVPSLLLTASITVSGCFLTHDPSLDRDASVPADASRPQEAAPIPIDAPFAQDAGPTCRGELARPTRACVGGELGHLPAGEGGSLELALDGCFCAERLTCAARASAGTIDLDVTLCPSPELCVACNPHVEVTCAIPPLAAGSFTVRVNGSEAFDVEARSAGGESGSERCFAIAPQPDDYLVCAWPGSFRGSGLTECHPSSWPAGEPIPVRFVDPCPSCFELDGPCEIRWDDSNEITLRPLLLGCDCPTCGACSGECFPRERTCTLPAMPAGRYILRVEGASGATAIDVGPDVGPEVCTTLPD